jgi:hypothetical protein
MAGLFGPLAIRDLTFANRGKKSGGLVLTFDTQLPQYFSKFFSNRCHVALCRADDADGLKR